MTIRDASADVNRPARDNPRRLRLHQGHALTRAIRPRAQPSAAGMVRLSARALTGLDRDSKARAEQVRSISVERVGERLGVVPNAIMLEVHEALRLHLSL